MKKKSLLILLGLAAAIAVSGCGNKNEKKKETEFTTDAPAATAEEDVIEETAAETEALLDPITPSDYLVENIDDYVTLGEVSGLPVTQYKYEVTDDMIAERIDMEVSAYSEETEVDRESKAGDIIYADITSTVQGDDDSEYTESTYITLGDEEYGAEFDEKMTGVSAGDTQEFSITFDDDIWMEEWMGQTVDFKVAVTSICEVKTPEYNDDFVAENTDYKTTEEYEAFLREEIEAENAQTSYTDAVEELYLAAENNAVFSDYPQELYDLCKEEVLAFYRTFAGTAEDADIYEMFGLTEEDVETEILAMVNRRLIASAICEKNELEITEDEYTAYVSEYAAYYGYEDMVQFEKDNSRPTLVWSLFESKAGDYLYKNAKITEEAYVPEEFDDLDIDEIDVTQIDPAEEDSEVADGVTLNTTEDDAAQTDTELSDETETNTEVSDEEETEASGTEGDTEE